MSGFVGIGLVPDFGGLGVPRTIGAPRARRLVLGGERLDAVTAFEWGIAERVVDDDHLVEEAIKCASKMAAWGSPPAFIEAKIAMLDTTDGFIDSLVRATEAQCVLMDTLEHRQRAQDITARR